MTIYVPRSSADIRSDILTDLDLGARQQGIDEPAVQPGTDWYNLADAVGRVGMVAYAAIEARDAATSELTATGKALDEKREALGLPEVPAGPATGYLTVTVDGTRTMPEGKQILINGIRYQTTQLVLGVVDGGDVPVHALDKGVGGNQPGGTPAKFVDPPLGFSEDAIVSKIIPLSGGVDAENDERKRERILNARRYKPEGQAGNIGHLRELAFQALASIQDCFVYCAPGGPGNACIVLTRAYDRDNGNYTRQVDDAALAIVRKYIQAKTPWYTGHYVWSVVDETIDVGLQITIPDSQLVGGPGGGWSDPAPWPPLVAADSGRVRISSASGNSITVTANTTTEPIDNHTRVGWWSIVDQTFYVYTVVSHSGSSGAWVLNLDRVIVDSNGSAPATNEWVSPAAEKMIEYGKTWLALMETLGPSEITTDADRLTHGAHREPKPDVHAPHDLTMRMIVKLTEAHPEITYAEIGTPAAGSRSPTVPASVDIAPNVLITNNFGIYPPES